MEPKEEPVDQIDSLSVEKEINNGSYSPLVEPKEEPLDDFLLMPTDNENVDQSIVLKEEKEEPLSDHFPGENEVLNQYLMAEDYCKKEEIIDDNEVVNLPPPSSPVKDEPVDEYIQDLVRFGQIPSWDAVLDQSARYGISPAITMEMKSEDVNEEANSNIGEKRKLLKEGDSDSVKKLRRPVEIDNLPLRKLAMNTRQCIFCEAFPTTSYGYAYHLHKYHNYPLTTDEIQVRCACGTEVRSHIRSSHHKCDGRQFTVIITTSGAPSTPQCAMCKEFPVAAFGYARHLIIHHNTSLTAEGFYLLCSCGVKITSDDRDPNHRCSGLQFTLHKSDLSLNWIVKYGSDARCVLCEEEPTSVLDYIHHLRFKHRSTLIQNGIYITCSCGVAIYSISSCHSFKCAGLHFTIHKLENKPNSTSQCILCHLIPATALSYVYHLIYVHKTTLAEKGIYLLCACGLELRSPDSYHNHSKECAGCNFTIHNLDEK